MSQGLVRMVPWALPMKGGKFHDLQSMKGVEHVECHHFFDNLGGEKQNYFRKVAMIQIESPNIHFTCKVRAFLSGPDKLKGMNDG